MQHHLNKVKFQEGMQKRGWQTNDELHTWIRPAGRTQAEAEANWIDAILESIDCPHEQSTSTAIATATSTLTSTSTSDTTTSASIDSAGGNV